jgi:hypothetical protein
VIRVVGDQVVTQMQWNRTLKAAQGSGAEVAATLEEAERMLETRRHPVLRHDLSGLDELLRRFRTEFPQSLA